MKPLSFYEYFKGNKKKTLSLITSIAFSIFLLGSIHMFLNNTTSSASQYTYIYNHFSVIFNSEQTIDQDIINELESKEFVKEVIPVERTFVMHKGIVVTTSTHTFKMNRDDIPTVLNILNIEYSAANLPQNDSGQMILNHNLIVNNDLNKGDLIDYQNGSIELHSGFESVYLTGFVPTSISDESNSYLIIPEDGNIEKLNEYLIHHNNNQYTVLNIDNMNNIIEQVIGDVKDLFNIVTVIVLISIGLGVGISTYVHYYQRRKEFAVLNTLGYSHNHILMRINKEILLTTAIALLSGMFMLLLEMFLMNELLLKNEGVTLFKLDWTLISRVAIIPLFISAFSLIPTWVLFKKLDSVLIIEGVN